ncbi:hypothetical protein [Gordonia malaquae]|uniref:hypothetical protein n=1 Tax=Gordonia malaquae TaxID=410332 RepID=UPI00301B40FE
MAIQPRSETGRNLRRIADNLRQRQVTVIVEALSTEAIPGDEDLRYLHSVIADAHAVLTRAVDEI